MQMLLARASECDEGITPELFQDNGWDPDAPENKDKKKPPHELITAKCGCEDLFAALQKALNKCYDAEKAKEKADKEKEKADQDKEKADKAKSDTDKAKADADKAKADADKAKADADKAKTAADKAKADAAKDKKKTAQDKADAAKAAKDAAAAAKDATTAATAAGKAAKDAATAAKNAATAAEKAGKAAEKAAKDAEKAAKDAEEAKKEVEKKWAELQDKLDTCKNYTGPKRQPLKPGEVRLKGLKYPGDGDVVLPPIPDKPTCKDLDDIEQKLLKIRHGLGEQGIGELEGSPGDMDAAVQQVNDALKKVEEKRAKLNCPKEQKSMLPPSPGQEQRNMAPGQSPPADETSGGSKLETTTSPGVVTKTISVMDGGELVGEVVANLPDDPTGTFTGTVEAKPAGKTDEERARNQAKLNDVVITVGDQQATPAANTFTCTIPPEAAKQPLPVIVTYKQKQIAKTFVPPPTTATSPQTTSTQQPWFCQTGRNVAIPQTYDGKVSPGDSTKIGGQTVPLVVETQKQRVVRDTSTTLGSTELEVTEQGQTTRTSIQNMSVQLSSSKSRLKQGEQATLKATISGAGGLTQPLGLEMTNSSINIVQLSGGNQRLVIQPSDVGAAGNCTKTFTLTGKTPGAFNIKATLEPPTKTETHR